MDQVSCIGTASVLNQVLDALCRPKKAFASCIRFAWPAMAAGFAYTYQAAGFAYT
jgi:hypothetical protein